MDNNFCPDEFKKWMQNQPDFEGYGFKKKNLVGLTVESKVPIKRFGNKILVEDGEFEDIIADFDKNGGTVSDVDGKQVLIETSKGSFFVHKQYIQEKEED